MLYLRKTRPAKTWSSAAPVSSIPVRRSTPSSTFASTAARSPSWGLASTRTPIESSRERDCCSRRQFVDPHVHLRTPGREDEETIASGTQAAAAGGYRAILAMPNTDPVLDSAAVLGSQIEAAQAEAEVAVGFLAAITKGQSGAELTEMGAGWRPARGLQRHWRPVAAAGLMRRALQYSAVTARRWLFTARSRRRPGTARCTKERSRPSSLRRLSVDRRKRDGGATCRSQPSSGAPCTSRTSPPASRSTPFAARAAGRACDDGGDPASPSA